MNRLLSSLEAADVPGCPTIIISLEGGATKEVVSEAKQFADNTKKYEVRIRTHEERLGLRRHILECGGHSRQFGSVIILEDDLYVDPQFYNYTVSALKHYDGDPRVGGIALYAPQTNEFCRLPFLPQDNGYDTYPMQTACSWGQAWSVSQWEAFVEWYENVDVSAVNDEYGLPLSLRNWPETSWKKYFAAWLVKTGRSFIYPYRAYSTNFSDEGGTNCVADDTRLQIPMATVRRPIPEFTFCPTEAPEVAYDAFMEPCGASIARALGEKDLSTIEIDTYGIKPRALLERKPEVVSVKRILNPRQIYGMVRRPLDANIGVSDAPTQGDPGLYRGPSNSVSDQQHRPNLAELSFRYGGYLTEPRFVAESIKATPRIAFDKFRRMIGSRK